MRKSKYDILTIASFAPEPHIYDRIDIVQFYRPPACFTAYGVTTLDEEYPEFIARAIVYHGDSGTALRQLRRELEETYGITNIPPLRTDK